MFLTQFDWLEEKCIAPKHFMGINLRPTVWCCADHSIKKLNHNRKISMEFFFAFDYWKYSHTSDSNIVGTFKIYSRQE